MTSYFMGGKSPQADHAVKQSASWNAAHSSSSSSVNYISERVESQRPPESRFKVTKILEGHQGYSDRKSVILPVSIFDENVIKLEDKSTDTEDQESKRCPLTLYEDDMGNVDSIQGVVKKTVEREDPTKVKKKANLGTFFGVFLPCCQNIVGVIYFVRFPWIVGTGGCIEAFLIVSICNMMSLCTAISMSAIATNGRVTAGGTYFMISRSLGPTFGGSVGFLFFLGTSISVAMYYLGTVETLLTYIAPQLALFGETPNDPARYHDYRVYGTILLLIMTTVVFIGVTCVSRFAFCAILFLVTALLSVFAGFALASPERSPKVCALGDRLMRYSLVYHNGSWDCSKNVSGAIHSAYCKSVNDTFECEDFYLNNEPEMLSAVPGFNYDIFEASWKTHYSEKGNVPASDIKAVPERELVNDLCTSFVVLLSIYFPSITGVESGSNYSGDLRDAQISIPRGTMAAVVVTSTIYLSSVVFMSATVNGLVLRDKYGESVGESGDLVLSLMAWPSKWVVLVGTLTATVGAGLQALAGGPRLLQAIAEDNIIPNLGFFAKKWHGEPVRGLMVTFCIAEIGILIAFLDYVAPIVTMFFLMCYGFINFAVTLQSLLDTPHWRPSFKCYHWSLTLFGTALCVTVMFMSSWLYALVAITLAVLLYHYIEYKGAEKEWGDGITGLSMSGALYALGRLKHDYKHTKNWRPQVLVLLKMANKNENPEQFSAEDYPLVMFANMLKEGKGLTVFATVLRGSLGDLAEEKEEVKQICATCLDKVGVKGFIEVLVCPSISDGLSSMVQSAGLGALRPNTIIMGWPKDWTDNRNVMSFHIFLDTMRNVAMSRNAFIVLKADDFPAKGARITGTIDIWWIVNILVSLGEIDDGGMLLLLGHLLRRSKVWSRCKLRLFSVAMENDNTVQIKKDLETYLYQLRIGGTVEVVEMAEDDMSAYVYERTLKMEERIRLMDSMAKKDRKGKSLDHGRRRLMGKEVQSVLENARSTANLTGKHNQHDDGSSPTDGRHGKRRQYSEREENMRHMETAIRLNALMKEKSTSASLVILNLPCVPETSRGQANYMAFLEVLTEGLDRLLLVRGTGREVITVYN